MSSKTKACWIRGGSGWVVNIIGQAALKSPRQCPVVCYNYSDDSDNHLPDIEVLFMKIIPTTNESGVSQRGGHQNHRQQIFLSPLLLHFAESSGPDSADNCVQGQNFIVAFRLFVFSHLLFSTLVHSGLESDDERRENHPPLSFQLIGQALRCHLARQRFHCMAATL